MFLIIPTSYCSAGNEAFVDEEYKVAKEVYDLKKSIFEKASLCWVCQKKFMPLASYEIKSMSPIFKMKMLFCQLKANFQT